MRLSLSAVAAFLTGYAHAACTSTWNHNQNGVDWPGQSELCHPDNNAYQSPIDLRYGNVRGEDAINPDAFPGLEPVKFDFPDKMPVTFTNNGHAINFVPVQPADGTPPGTVTGGILGGRTGCFLQSHMHWSGGDNEGSEHTVEGEQTAMEMHFVFYDCQYPGNVEAFVAAHQDHDRASDPGYWPFFVFGLFFEVEEGAPANAALQPAMDALAEGTVLDFGDAPGEYEMDFLGLFPNRDTSTFNYFGYLGGFTTPTCNPIVRWHVFETKTVLPPAQANQFFTIRACDGQPHPQGNFRVTVGNDNPLFFYDANPAPAPPAARKPRWVRRPRGDKRRSGKGGKGHKGHKGGKGHKKHHHNGAAKVDSSSD